MKKIFFYIGNIAEAVVALFLYGILQNLYFIPKKSHFSGQQVVTALVTVVVIVIIFWMYKQQLKNVNEWDFNKEPHWKIKKIVIAIIGLFLITFLGSLMLQLISQGKTISTNQQELDKISNQGSNLFKIMVVFIAPICEEVIFRGMFFNTFFTKATKLNKWGGILVSGFLFAYMHDPHITHFILVYWVLGCVLGWVYMSTKDLRYSMMTHMAYNLLGFI